MNAPQTLHPHDHRHCIDDALSRAEMVCAERGARMTPLRRRVLELVWDSHAPIGAYAIMDLLRAADDRAAAPPTVYRALEFLLDQGLVHKIESLNAFVGCDRPEERHVSQFLICTSCKAAIGVKTFINNNYIARFLVELLIIHCKKAADMRPIRHASATAVTQGA